MRECPYLDHIRELVGGESVLSESLQIGKVPFPAQGALDGNQLVTTEKRAGTAPKAPSTLPEQTSSQDTPVSEVRISISAVKRGAP